MTAIVQKISLIVDWLRAENIFNELRAKMVDKLRAKPPPPFNWLRGKRFTGFVENPILSEELLPAPSELIRCCPLLLIFILDLFAAATLV